MRAIVFLLFIILVFFIVRFVLNRIIEIRQQNRQQELDQENTKTSTAEPMVQCALCGIHLPQSSAYYDGQDTFCSEGHMAEFHNKKSDET